VRREVRFAARRLRRRPLLALVLWSLPEAVPAAASGLVLARAVDDGFLAGRPGVGLAWLAGLLAAAGVGAVGSRQVFRRLGDLVEPVRDDLVRRVVGGALRDAVAGRRDEGAVARLTRQVEVVRDTLAGLIVVLRGFLVTLVGVAVGLSALAPVIAALVLVPFGLGVAAFAATLGLAAARQRAAVLAEERVAATAGPVLAGVRDVVARGAHEHAVGLVTGPVAAQASAERALARVAVLRALSFALGGWVPLLVVLGAAGWLVGRGLTAGAILGGLMYVLFGLQPALQGLIGGVGGSGLRFVVTLGRILDVTTGPVADAPARPPASGGPPEVFPVVARGVTYAYGPSAEPVLRDVDLRIGPREHLAIIGPSGIGKSTFAALLCGLDRPGAGEIRYGPAVAADLAPDRLARARVLIPQEAYVFEGTVGDNVTYLRPDAPVALVRRALAAVGAAELVVRLGGLDAPLRPGDLSAGERQLLALARAWLSPAPLVVLDEATCHLDPVAERRAEEAFAARGALVVVAHRLSSAVRADRVLVLDGARAVVGDHRTLLTASPLYRELIGGWAGPVASVQSMT
jgi:ATP-binding cassette subfamily C protein